MDRDDDWEGGRRGTDWEDIRDEERGVEGGYTASPGPEALRPREQRPSRAPRAYQRTDERIREDVYECLCGETGADASEVEVTVHEGEVTLAGTVPDREDKRRVERLAERVRGVKEVFNRLRVQTPS